MQPPARGQRSPVAIAEIADVLRIGSLAGGRANGPGRSHRPAQAMRFYGLSKMLEAAEIAARIGAKDEATSHLRELQAHCERMVALLNPDDKKARVRMVAA